MRHGAPFCIEEMVEHVTHSSRRHKGLALGFRHLPQPVGGGERRDATAGEQRHIAGLGHLQHLIKAAMLQQRVAGLDGIHQRRCGHEETFGVKEFGKLPGEFRRVEALGLRDTAQKRDDAHAFQLPPLDEGQHLMQRAAPAHAHGHAIGHDAGDIGARRRGNRPGRIAVRIGERRDDGLAQAEALFQLALQLHQRGNVRLDADDHLAPLAGIGQEPRDENAVHVQLLGNFRLGQPLDIIEPGSPDAELAVLVGRAALPRSVRLAALAVGHGHFPLSMRNP